MKKKKLDLTWFENGELKSVKGVIPIVEDKLNFVFLDRKEGEWAAIKNHPAPLIQFTKYGQPLTKEQLDKLVKGKGK